ncbi:MAG TPA: hypothetical protein VHO50_01915 [Bacteroidales bacterium]|nr:hypothetical protein [Bacteroidales bacterium]
MNAKILLLIIDMQYDFCSQSGSLYVDGSENDGSNLAHFIRKNESVIDSIILSQDSHNVVDISHPVFWEDKNGRSPKPFTQISLKKVLGGIWQPRYQRGKAIEYLRKLERQGEFQHTIWPEHCILGTHGAAIIDEVMEPVKQWSRKGKYYEIIVKGTNPLTEHFGVLKANVPLAGFPETHLNTDLLNKFLKAQKIYIAGEARSHCVATTIKQLLPIAGIAKKLYILEDCMSSISGFEKIAAPIFDKAHLEGASFVLSTHSI